MLPHVLWLGGSACAGKTTAARALAAAHGLTLYSCDDRFEEHRRRASPERHPHFHRLMDQPPEALWAPPVATQVRDLLLFYEDELAMVVEDLRSLPGPVIAEGVGLLPALVSEVLAEPHRACWLIATPEFRRRHYPKRGLADLLSGYPDPQRAYDDWMTRDDEIAYYLETQVAALALPCQVIDGGSTEAETAAALARQFHLQE
ncbi:MAG TPA: hypothetical protein VGS07_18630 [Thermoanaerobaculia bacterium]|nr:hypothetical protein [Thermoanaerobaculia bacterium]